MGSVNHLRVIIVSAVTIALVVILSGFIRKQASKQQVLYKKYMLHLVRLVIIGICLVDIMKIIDPNLQMSSLVLKGSALIVAIVGFAAQPAISDLIAGLLISINKPFEVGDRIVVEGEEPGIVEDITLRHTVIRIYDDIRIIVPNSELNTKTVTNTSYKKTDRRGIHMRFAVSYDTDVSRAIDVIRDCVAESPYTLSVTENGVTQDSGPVYFLEFADSALMLDTTIWVTRTTSSYVAKTDINLRVNRAFKKNGIEIPYNYLNVIEFKGEKSDAAEAVSRPAPTRPSKRHFRSNTVKYEEGKTDISEAIALTRAFTAHQRIGEKEAVKLELLTEEALGITSKIAGGGILNMWVEGSGFKYSIHITFPSSCIGSDEYKDLIGLSSSGRNEAVKDLSGKIREIMVMGLNAATQRGKEEYSWSLKADFANEDEIGRNILTTVADDIRVSVSQVQVEFIVVRSAENRKVKKESK